MSEEKTLREALEAQAHLWHHMAEADPDDDGEASAGREVYDECAGDLARVLADYPDEPEPAKVIVVTEHGGRKRRFAASRFGMTDNGQLAIGEPVGGDPLLRIDPVAGLNAGRWADVAYEGAELAGDLTGKALGIAKAALELITTGPDDVVGIASGALGEIYAKTEL